MRDHDAVTVGGSYAGLSCARSAAARGLHTLVLGRKRDLGEKIRTTGIFSARLLQVPGSRAIEVRYPCCAIVCAEWAID